MTPSFSFSVLPRIIIIALAGIISGWLLTSGKPVFYGLTLLTILAILIFNLIHHINKTGRKISYFFESVRNEDFTLSFPAGEGDKHIRELATHLERINRQIQQIHFENRRQEQFLEALIEHVGTGILTFNRDGFVIHSNSTLKSLLGMKQFSHLRQLERIDESLAETIKNIKLNEKKLHTFNSQGGNTTLLIKSSAFRDRDQLLTLVSMQDIKKELDEKELESWIKLIRVLIHEIMNSIAPVTSLSESLCNYYMKDGETIPVAEVSDRMIRNTIRGLKVIHEQGKGLISFVESYRKLTRLPKPERMPVRVTEFLEKTIVLCNNDFLQKAIKISYMVDDPEIQINIDEKLISQVLINLLKNSVEALDNIPGAEIMLVCRRNASGQVEITVKDNGPGIPPEIIDEIFIPFFTTRENGSGIGLSLSRQIMKVHNGSLTVRSLPGKETLFTMVFN
jgi:two-component system, NtrC family, nitrogen regulation sensor histidine kinase NtrY